MPDEQAVIWREAVVSYLKLPSSNFFGDTQRHYEKHRFVCSVMWPTFSPSASRGKPRPLSLHYQPKLPFLTKVILSRDITLDIHIHLFSSILLHKEGLKILGNNGICIMNMYLEMEVEYSFEKLVPDYMVQIP